jgi:AcrR family transcriptional regulator
MSPRPKKASDEAVFAATLRVMSRLGPAELTLAAVAAEAGVTAGALVQRFGSKRGLQLTMAERLAGASGELFASLAASSASPLAALYAYGDGMAGMAPTAAALTRNLAWLLQDLTDPELRAFTVAHAAATRRELRRIVEAAIAAGELKASVDAAAAARAIDVTVSGSLLSWAFYEEGTAAAWVRQDLEATLHPMLTARGRASSAQGRPRSRRESRPRR